MKQFVLPPEADGSQSNLRLSGKDFHYLIRVRRCGPGDRIPALTRDGRRVEMVILSVSEQSCMVNLSPSSTEDESDRNERSSQSTNRTDENSVGPRITLMPAITKGKKMDMTVRQAVEAGASSVWPLLTEFCQVKYSRAEDAESKRERWEKIFVEALQQCGAALPPSVQGPMKISDAMSAWNGRGPVFFLHERRLDSGNIHPLLVSPPEEIAIIVGPEGGLSAKEADRLLDGGAHPIHLGDRILRAETAAVYGLAAIGTIIRERELWLPA